MGGVEWVSLLEGLFSMGAPVAASLLGTAPPRPGKLYPLPAADAMDSASLAASQVRGACAGAALVAACSTHITD